MNSPYRRVYLDHNATCPLLPEARTAMVSALDELGGTGNPSSPHAFGHRARLVLEEARAEVAALIGADPAEIVFVSGGTEADNLAIEGVARAEGDAGRIVTSTVEHPAVLEPCRRLSGQGWRLTLLPVDSEGRVDPGAVRAACEGGATLVSVMAANNETGVIQPIAEIAEAASGAGARVHSDAVQAAGRVPLDVRTMKIDLMSLSSHKIGGPAGIGALYVRRGTLVKPLLLGGGQEGKMRPGTEAPALAAGFAAAARAARRDPSAIRLAELGRRLESELTRLVPGARINGAGASRLPGTTSVTLPGLDNETLVIRLDLAGFAISTGSACSTGSSRPSHVLAAMGLTSGEIGRTVRIGLGPATTTQDVGAFLEALAACVVTPEAVGRPG